MEEISTTGTMTTTTVCRHSVLHTKLCDHLAIMRPLGFGPFVMGVMPLSSKSLNMSQCDRDE